MYFLNINKPKGITSFDVIRHLRKVLKIKQIGHSGTLDPLAHGVMQVGVGSATKLLEYLDSDKEYIAQIVFGYNSSTYDDEGDKEFIKTPDFNKDELISVLNKFIGKSMQMPPKYSAIKKDGKKLCDIIRKSNYDSIDIEPREIEIYSIELLEFNKDNAVIKVSCKKGTYIRSLVYDIGQVLGCGAYLKNLKRTKAGNFLIEDSDELDNDNYKKISPLTVLNLESYELDDFEFQRISNGNFIKTDKKFDSKIILLTKNNKLVSVANLSDNLIKPKKFFGGAK